MKASTSIFSTGDLLGIDDRNCSLVVLRKVGNRDEAVEEMGCKAQRGNVRIDDKMQ